MSNNRTVDVAVVGGGVAGASLAAVLSRAGLAVTLIERESRFRDRVRGEGIHPWGVAEAERLDLLPVLCDAGATELTYWQTYQGGSPIPDPRNLPGESNSGYGEWSVYHPALQDALLNHAVSFGVEVLRPAKATTCIPGDSPELTVETPEGALTIRSRIVVVADGRQSGARRWIGAQVEQDPPDHHLIGGCLLRGTRLPTDRVHFGLGLGYASLLFPQTDYMARAYLFGIPEIAGQLRGPKHVPDFIEKIESVLGPGTLEGSEPAGPLAFFPGTNAWADRLTGPGVVLIGDAAMATDPSVGHGLSLVFRDVRELRDLLLDGGDWQSAIEEFARRRQAYQAPCRSYALWLTDLFLDTGQDGDARRARFRKARQLGRDANGYGAILVNGPGDGLPTDESARRHWLGEDLELQ